MKEIDITGQKFGLLTAVKRVPNRTPKGAIYWEFKCGYGTIKPMVKSPVVQGRLTSCGCNHHAGRRIDISGQRFAALVTVERDISKKSKIYWYYKCDCGNTQLCQKGYDPGRVPRLG